MNRLAILNTGGTFNKRYDPIEGKLFVPEENEAIERITASMAHNLAFIVDGLIYKDSLDMNEADRMQLCDAIDSVETSAVVVVHGTDTMHQSAQAAAKRVRNKRIIFTGAMIPFSIDPVEATANLALAIAAARQVGSGVFIAMHGLILPYDRIVKNREAGRFEAVTP